MPTKRCCCGSCRIFTDDFNRASLGSNYVGDGTIVSGALHADETVLKVCQGFELGAFYAHVLLRSAGDASVYTIRVGDPNGGYLVQAVFGGAAGTGTMTLRISLDDGGSWVEEYEYAWEYAEETIFICYTPGLQISVGPTTRSSGSGGAGPVWVTTCIPLEPHDNCWPGPKGNWTFVEGVFDDFVYEYHWIEKRSCQKCDCFCWDGEAHCVPETLYVTLGGPGLCFNGTYEMTQAATLTTSTLDPPTITPVPQKYEWVSEPIYCPYEGHGFTLTLRCEIGSLDPGDTYPRFRLELRRWGYFASANNSALGFDLSDPDTEDSERGSDDMVSVSYSKPTSTCDPFYLEFPDIIDDMFAGNETTPSCCGGYVQSGDPPVQSPATPPIGVIITE